MGVLTLFTMYKENNIIMVALEKDEAGMVSQLINAQAVEIMCHVIQGPDNVWTYHTTMSKFSEVYGLKVSFKDGETAQTRSAELEK